MSQLTQVSIDHFKRISNVEVMLQGNMIVISGNNAQGKSSFLDSIACTLGGKKLIPEKPIHGEAKKGEITITTDEGLEITRRFWIDKKGSLKSDIKIKTADGGTPASPQKVLNGLTSSLAFDPLAFSQQDNKKRLATLCEVYNVDVSGLNDMRRAKYEERTLIGRDLKNKEGELKALPVPMAGESTEPVDIAELLQKVQDLQRMETARANCQREVQSIVNRIEELTVKMNEAKRDLDNANHDLSRIPDKREEIESLRTKIENAQEDNERARDLHQRKKVVEQHTELQSKHDKLSKDIKEIDDKKQKELEEMTGAIPGLGVDDAGTVTYQGVSFDDASTAEKLEVSTRMAIAMQPEDGIRLMLIRAGNDLDQQMLQKLHQLAKDNDVQILLERIVPDGEITIQIEDGKLKG